MKQKILLIALLIINFSLLISQETWLQTYDPFPGWQNPSYRVEDVIVCSDSGYAVSGTYNGFNFQEEFKWGFVVKTDSDGNMEWAKQDTIHNYLVHTTGTGMIETTDGYIISVGYSPSFGTYLIKRDLEGNRIWRRTMTDFTIQSIDTTDNGNIILGGSQDLNIALRKINEEGYTLWTNVNPIVGNYTVCNSIVSLQDGGYALTGLIENIENPDIDVLVMKTNTNGDSLWTRTYDDGFGGHDEGQCIIENSEEHILVSGYFVFNGGIHETILIKYSSNGDLIFFLNGSENGNNYSFRSMVEDNYNDRIIGYGSIENTLALNAYDYEGENQWNELLPIGYPGLGDKCLKIVSDGFILGGGLEGNDDITLVKTNLDGQVVGSDDYIIPEMDILLSCYPNPFNPIINFEIKAENLNNLQIEIFNIKGQKIKTILLVERNVSWNANNNASGIYLCKLINVDTDMILSVKKVTLLK